VLGRYMPDPSPVTPCGGAADPLTGDVYIGSPGANGDVGGVFVWRNSSFSSSSGNYTLLIDPSKRISCMACVCPVSVVRGSSPPPPPNVPTLQALSPINGSVDGGYPVYLWGSGFANVSSLSCRFGHSLSEAQYLAPAFVSCVVPSSPVAGSTSVQVSNDGQNWSVQKLSFTYLEEKRQQQVFV